MGIHIILSRVERVIWLLPRNPVFKQDLWSSFTNPVQTGIYSLMQVTRYGRSAENELIVFTNTMA
jgi:hypothetical protein